MLIKTVDAPSIEQLAEHASEDGRYYTDVIGAFTTRDFAV
jgi:hypothetical protein